MHLPELARFLSICTSHFVFPSSLSFPSNIHPSYLLVFHMCRTSPLLSPSYLTYLLVFHMCISSPLLSPSCLTSALQTGPNLASTLSNLPYLHGPTPRLIAPTLERTCSLISGRLACIHLHVKLHTTHGN
jgi:hypothetical protein